MKFKIRQVSLLLFLVLSILLYSCNVPGVTSTQVPTEAPVQDQVQLDGLAEGTLMSWVDGSTLVFYNGVWVYRSEVTNYQFSLCVEAGICLLPYIDAPSPELIDPQQANSPAQIIGPEDKQSYCTWAGGRVLTDEESASLGLYKYSPSGAVDTTSILIGLLSPGTEDGLRCIVDAPVPMAAACETSAFYLNGTPTETDHAVTEAGRFCQKGQGYVTLDFDLPDGGNLESVNGDCDVVGDHRILCSNQSIPNGGGEALILINGLLPAVQRNGVPAAGQMQCLPGYEANAESPAGCSFGELLPAVQKDSGLAAAQFQTSQDQLTGQVSLVVYQSNSMPSTILDLTCPEPLYFSERLGRCVFDIPAEDLARAGRNTDTLPIWNPLTGYPPPNADGTCPEGSSLLNGLYCIPNEPPPAEEDCIFFRHSSGYGSNFILTNGNNCGVPPGWDPITGFQQPNADGSTCPEGTALINGRCIPSEPPPSEDESVPLSFELQTPYWNPFLGYPPANADGTCPEGSTNFYGFCVPDEPDPSEEEDSSGLGFGWDPITGYPPRNPDGTCPEGTALFLDLYCIPNAASRNEGPSLGISWDPIGGFPLPDGFGGCPEGSALLNGRCLPSEPPPSGSEGLTGSGSWNPLAAYPSSNEEGICPPGSTLISGHCIPSQPPPTVDPRCMLGYWFSETLGVCLPDVTLGCPVGTYFDKKEGLCIASGEPTSLTLPGFHFDEAAQCSRSDLPSGRYPGCPDGQAYDPSTGSCDFKNIHVDGGKVLQTVKFNFSAPSCEVKDNGGGDDGDSVNCSQYTTDSTCLAAGCSYDYIIKACK